MTGQPSADDDAGDDLNTVQPKPSQPRSTEPRARAHKAPSAFRTISEVAEELHIPQHVLRFWEGKFTQVKPLKRGGGRRYYRPDDIALLRGIASLLYVQGYTIKGVQRLLREGGGQLSDDIPPPTPEEKAAALSYDQLETDELQLPMPGLVPPSAAATSPQPKHVPALRKPTKAEAERLLSETMSAELARLQRVLRATLRELEALRALIR